MSIATQAFAAQSALVSLLTSTLTGWKCGYGIPDRTAAKMAFVPEKVDQWTRETPLSGAVTSQEEAFVIHAALDLQMTGATAAEIRNAMSTAAGSVDAAIASAPTLSGTVAFAHVSGLEYNSGMLDATVRAAELILDVTCTAHLG